MQVQCQCGLTSFPIPHDRPIMLVVCHCNKCKLSTGSVFHISAVFPYFELPLGAMDNLSTYRMGSDSGSSIDAHFCKGCGNRVFYTKHSEGEPLQWISISAPRIVEFDWAMLQDRKLTTHWWTSQAVMPVPEGFTAWPVQATDEQVMDHFKRTGLLDAFQASA